MHGGAEQSQARARRQSVETTVVKGRQAQIARFCRELISELVEAKHTTHPALGGRVYHE